MYELCSVRLQWQWTELLLYRNIILANVRTGLQQPLYLPAVVWSPLRWWRPSLTINQGRNHVTYYLPLSAEAEIRIQH